MMNVHRHLIKGALAGQAQAVEQLDQWIRDVAQSRLWGWAERQETVVHQVRQHLLAQFKQRGFRVPADLRQYVYTFTEQIGIASLRRQYRLPDADSLRQELAPSASFPHRNGASHSIDERQLFFQVFHALPNECRQLWRLIFLEERSYPETAERLQTDAPQIRRRFQQCRQYTLGLWRQLAAVPFYEPADGDSERHPESCGPERRGEEELVRPSGRAEMGCRGVSEWLPAYALEQLTTEARARIAQHLSGCRTCALELADLRRFNEAIKRYGPVLLEDHPTAEMLTEYARHQAAFNPHQHYQLTRHLALCHTCRLEHRVLLRVNESLDITRPHGDRKEAAATQTIRTDGVHHVQGLAARPHHRRRWVLWAMAGVVLIGVLALFMFLKPSLRADYPTGEIEEPPQSFSWTAVPGARSYRVGLYTKQKRIIWQSRHTPNNRVTLPSHVVAQLNPDEPYVWQVIVHLENGRVTRSPLFEFTIRQISRPN